MAANSWNWKGKDGSRGGLLYEPGNWGDLLKMLWLAALLRWKGAGGAAVNYFDPFAGEAKYPFSAKSRLRFEAAGLAGLDFIRPAFVDAGFWPSSASAAGLLAEGVREVFDADPGRRAGWAAVPGYRRLEGEGGWALLEGRSPDPDGVWLLDPYDFLADWRKCLPIAARQAESTTILLYIYNRSARSAEAFGDYRAFRAALEDARGSLPKRLGRVAADVFLPRAHHEMLLLPGRADAGRGDFGRLAEELEAGTAAVNAAVLRAGMFGA